MKKILTPSILIIFGILAIIGFYYLLTQSIQSFSPLQKENNNIPTTVPTKTSPLLDGQYICTINAPTNSVVTIQLNQGKAYATTLAKSGDHIQALYEKDVLYMWDQEKLQGTKFTKLSNVVSQVIDQNKNSCKKTTFTETSQFILPSNITFKENTSNNPFDILQSLQ